MATVPGQLIWEIVNTNNPFLVKQFGRGTASLQFSKENNNLYNLNSYNLNLYKQFSLEKGVPVNDQCRGKPGGEQLLCRPDLKRAALARLSAVHRSLKVSKSGAKKKNRQAVRLRGEK